eukprot:m.77942 g.77942  ORF g.77942 m.77942 type:complete len:521 (+) comp12649_c0_seq2:188-1750(+)
MYKHSAVLVIIVVAACHAPKATAKRVCGMHDIPESQRSRILKDMKQSATKSKISRRSIDSDPFPDLLIPIQYYVFYGHSYTAASVSPQRLEAQTLILNQAYSGCTDPLGTDMNVTFVNLEPRYIPESEISYTECRKSLADGRIIEGALVDNFEDDKKKIYVFICDLDDLGFVNFFPWETEENGTAAIYIGADTLADELGRSTGNYGGGDTLVHEMGHYFGLLHTFEGGCRLDGDLICDTPAQKSPNYGFCITSDGCDLSSEQNYNFNYNGGFVSDKDPVENFMDYSFDSCMTRFTPQQTLRARLSLETYHPSHVANWAAAAATSKLIGTFPAKQCSRPYVGTNAEDCDFFCDNQPDCDNIQPEENVQCASNEFKCDSGDECIPNNYLCDGFLNNWLWPDCPDGSDETQKTCGLGCSDTQRICTFSACVPAFACADGSDCIPDVFKCDGVPQCADGSDELDCRAPQVSSISFCDAFELENQNTVPFPELPQECRPVNRVSIFDGCQRGIRALDYSECGDNN